jgi:hypothetical protein
MRISVTNSDPGYFAGSYRCTAYLDGVKLDNCVTADEEEGLALCYDMSEEGRQYARMSGEVRLIELRGEVEINTRDENGVCIMCGVSGAEMHHDDCPRAKEWNHLNLAGCTTEAQAKRHAAFVAATEREVAFGDPAKSGGIVEGSNGERFLVTGSSAWVGEDGVKREAPEFTRVGTKTVEHNFSTAHAKTIDIVRELWRKQMAYQWGGKFWRVMSISERWPGGAADVRSIEAHRPATFFDLQGWLISEIESVEIEPDCPPLPVARGLLRPSTISKLMARRRKLIAKAKRASPTDSAVGSAIAAMNNLSANRKANDL